ncbi:DUF4935 domain-containing protein [Duganella sp. BJB1802]|uniref:PIN domain-containing protein n=1 Tax=Duganella sp. BJB1802 TaxID=2744575 RepID=UPI001592BB2F|nr:PIN domain-containing protein [Duganella sp. BJB1802]NVD74916.1 DUF4935 domain-containing protein [Duganella sp. BJB1802]
MNRQTEIAKPKADDAANRIKIAKEKVLDGTIGAISVDTCIFTEAGYRLENGNLKRLEQFKGNKFRLVFSEVTLGEIFGHITKHSDEAKTKLTSALRSIGKYWHDHAGKQNAIVDELLCKESGKAVASKRMKDFVMRCGAHLIEAKSTLDVSDLLKHYFNVQPPFEVIVEKKSEFPDAITLLSLQAWAKKERTAILFVTKDKGCKRFCEESSYLFAIDDLGDALTVIQDRNVHRAELCRKIEGKIINGDYPDLVDRIESAIAEDIWSIDWIPEASAAYYYEPEFQDVELVSATFSGFNGNPELSAIDYRDKYFVAQVSINLEVSASCSFSFSAKDSIDRDMVSIGDATVTRKRFVEVDILLTFEEPDTDIPEIVEIELIPSRCDIDFGNIEPDYGDEDPSSEYY